jgi:hypothetical protein
MMLNYGDSLFLKQIAQKYCKKIERVTFMPLKDRCLGMALRSVCRQSAVILIDPRKHHCSYQIIFTLLHEVRHIKLGLLVKQQADGELQVDQWAFRESGLIDRKGRVEAKDVVCYLCIKTTSGFCLKIQFDVDCGCRDVGGEQGKC